MGYDNLFTFGDMRQNASHGLHRRRVVPVIDDHLEGNKVDQVHAPRVLGGAWMEGADAIPANLPRQDFCCK